MKRTGAQRAATRRTSRGRIAAAAVVLGALSAVALVPATAGAATDPRTATEIATVKNAKLGTILVSDGSTVYALKSGKAACTTKCLKVWTPVELPEGVTTPTAGAGVDESKLGTAAAADGAVQVTYSGKPLYWSVKDKSAGQVKGNITDKWGKWATVATVKAKSGGGDPNAGTGGTSF
jgi:predicted lipoprotein with Yx(FWY)xxD motif